MKNQRLKFLLIRIDAIITNATSGERFLIGMLLGAALVGVAKAISVVINLAEGG